MYQETRKKPKNVSHVAPRHPARRITSAVAGEINGNTSKHAVLVAATVFDLRVKSA